MSLKSRFQKFFGLETKSGVSNPDPWLFEQFSGGTSAAGVVVNRVDGKPVELIRLDPETSPVTVDSSNGEPVYTVQEGANRREIARESILHIPSPSMSGRGLAYDARNSIGLVLVLERYANRLFANGVRPGSLLLAKDAKTPEAVKNIKALFNAQFSGDGTGSNAVLPGDLTYQQLTLSSVDAQFLEIRKFEIEEIARHLRVPPHILYEMSRATWGNSEEMSQHFLDFTMMRWITAWEGELRLKLFPNDSSHFAEFQTDNFVRANYAARMEGLSKAIAARVLNPNEARAILNLPPYEGGDEFINPNVQTADPA